LYFFISNIIVNFRETSVSFFFYVAVRLSSGACAPPAVRQTPPGVFHDCCEESFQKTTRGCCTSKLNLGTQLALDNQNKIFQFNHCTINSRYNLSRQSYGLLFQFNHCTINSAHILGTHIINAKFQFNHCTINRSGSLDCHELAQFQFNHCTINRKQASEAIDLLKAFQFNHCTINSQNLMKSSSDNQISIQPLYD
jgi:hypothetical protein